MKKYYYIVRNGDSIALGCGDSLGGEEITKEEYDDLLTEIRVKTALVNNLYSGEITIEDVAPEWREEIQRRVDAQMRVEAEAKENAEATIEDYKRALAELGVVL